MGLRKRQRKADILTETVMFFPPGTNRYFRKIAAEVGFDISFADLTKLEELKAALKPNTKVHLADSIRKLLWERGWSE